jgi:Kef-type K+ transport system membrane component KefB
MSPLTLHLITLGALLLASHLAKLGAARFNVPQVSLLLLLGLLIGPMGLNTLPDGYTSIYPAVAQVSLAMVGFLLGGELTLENLRARGRSVFILSLAVTLATALSVGAGALLFGLSLPLALILASAATATDPAACQSVINELDTSPSTEPSTGLNTKPESAQTILGVVAIDDLWGILVFSGVLTYLSTLTPGANPLEALKHGLFEVGGSLALGLTLGALMALVTGRLTAGKPTREEAIGFVLLSAGLAQWLGLSYLLVAVAMGASVAQLARHHTCAFREIEQIEWPTLVVFFILSGASLNLSGLQGALSGVALYVVARVLGRVLGGVISERLHATDGLSGASMGLALLPQAGVALGMTLVASEHAPAYGEQALTIVAVSTVIFELVGPLLTRRVLLSEEAQR